MGAGSTIGYALEYGNIIVLGSVFVILSNAIYGILRGEGDAKRTMYAMIATSILNMVLDPLFIYVFGMGVAGAAYATIISLAFVNIVLLYFGFMLVEVHI